MPLEALPPGSPYPLINGLSTEVWVEFWNIVFKSWIEDKLSSSSGTSGWPTPFTKNGKLLETENDGLEAQMTVTPSLSIILPTGGKWILGGTLIELDDNVSIADITPNFTGWIEPVATYSEEFDTYIWTHNEHAVRPALGTGVAAKVTTLADRVDTLVATEVESDVIPTLPIILKWIRALTGGGAPIEYLSQLKYTPQDERNAVTVLEEKLALILQQATDAGEGAGIKDSPTETDQIWELLLGVVRIVRELHPTGLRFINVGSVRPGIQGTASAPDTELFDRGGTLPENVKERNFSAP